MLSFFVAISLILAGLFLEITKEDTLTTKENLAGNFIHALNSNNLGGSEDNDSKSFANKKYDMLEKELSDFEPESVEAEEGTLLWAHQLAQQKAKLWESDANLAWASLNGHVYMAEGELNDGKIDNGTISQIGAELQYISPESPGKCYWVGIRFSDGKVEIVDDLSEAKDFSTDCQAIGREMPIDGWELNTDSLMNIAIDEKKEGEYINKIEVSRAKDKRKLCPLIDDTFPDRAILTLYIGASKSIMGINSSDRQVYYDAVEGTKIATLEYEKKEGDLYVPSGCVKII